jgi:Damage-control phosphatase ARMT1-like domain
MPPAPIRTDGSNPFARFSMEVRVPKILDEVVEHNPDYPPRITDAVRRLADAIRADRPLPPLGFPAPDTMEWEAGLAARAGASWLHCDWFFAECYVYRCLADAVRFWETGRDPFAPVKGEENARERLWQGLDDALALSAMPPVERLHALLARGVWGNRVDLSYAVGVAFGAEGAAEDLLADDRGWAVPRLLVPDGRVELVADNAGSELAMDLVLADALVSMAGARVTLHVKTHPTFVSDATVPDVWQLVRAMEGRGPAIRALGERLREAFDQERLRVAPDPFWNGPRFLWDLPPHLRREQHGAAMVVLKGDANYRRVVGDAIWAAGTFEEATKYSPVPLLCMRTLKSDALVGVAPDEVRRLDGVDPEWRINGRRGVIQGGPA